MNYWLSWYAPVGEAFELHSPWWRSGFEPGGRDTIVAAVRAPDEEAAWKAVADSYDNPVEFERRFISARSLDWVPWEASDRFPKADWMAWDPERTCACGSCPVKAG